MDRRQDVPLRWGRGRDRPQRNQGASRANLATDPASTSGDVRERTTTNALTTDNLLSIHNSRLGDQLLSQPIQLEHILPNFISKHVREWCDHHCPKSPVDKPAQPGAEAGSPGVQADKTIKISSSVVPGVGIDNIIGASPTMAEIVHHRHSACCNVDTLESPYLAHMAPSAEETFAAVVMADVSGYSNLTSTLAERGPSGAEILGKTMKGYLDKIIQTILLHGGDIVKFAGDAVIFYWSLDPRKEDIEDEATRGELVLKASYCCMDLLNNLGIFPIDIPMCEIKVLRIHLGIGAGTVYDVHVGVPTRWEHFIAGDAVNQISGVLDIAKAGELAMSHQALRSLSVILELGSVTIGDYDKRCIILQGLEKARRKLAPPLPASNDDLALWDIVPPAVNVELYRNFINQSALFKLQADISQSRLFHLESGLTDLLGLYELRQVTTVFIRIGSLRRWESIAKLQEAQEAMRIVQSAFTRFEGSLRQFHVDEKGAVILAFFGLPPLAHENDATFGIKAALEICSQFTEMFDDFSIGITTGVVSIGGVGNSVRTEYAVMGDSINMAARLMCHTEAKQSLLCDERSFNLCEQHFVFDKLGETKVKGKTHPISIFRPKGIVPEKSLRGASVRNPLALERGELVGRYQEKQAIRSALEEFDDEDVKTRDPMITILEAESGQGLSSFVEWTQMAAARRSIAVCTGGASETEKATPFYAWREILTDLCNVITEATVNPDGTLTFKLIPLPDEMMIIPKSPEAPAAASPEKTIPTVKRDIWASVRQRSRKSLMGGEDAGRRSVSFAGSEGATPLSLARSASSASSSMGRPNIDTEPAKLKAVAEVSEARPIEQNSPAEGCSPSQPIKQVSMKDKIFAALPLVGFNDTVAAYIFGLIFPNDFDVPHQEHGQVISTKLQVKELTEVICKILKAVAASNSLVLVFHESQWMDALSWELLFDVITSCKGIQVFVFTRLEKYFDNQEALATFKKIKRHNDFRIARLKVNGLSLFETKELIQYTWPSPIKKVDDYLVENIHKRTEGKPLYIRSLVTALQESGQYRVDSNGLLTTQGDNFNFDHIVVGQDHQSIILAQFDRLDRTFQLFLKIAAVLGQRFAVDDVLHFLIDMPVFSERFERRNYSQIARKIQQYDKYGFLVKHREGMTFQFKSVAVRNCIYSMMVLSQRQQLHLNIALYYEAKIKKDEEARQSLLVPLFEHYMETDDNQMIKKVKYQAEVAKFSWEQRWIAETIKHYNTLMKMTENVQEEKGLVFFDKATVATWHRELGEAYFWKNDVLNAERHLVQSLHLVGHDIPTSSVTLRWRIHREMANKQRWKDGLIEEVEKEGFTIPATEISDFDKDEPEQHDMEQARKLFERSVHSIKDTTSTQPGGLTIQQAMDFHQRSASSANSVEQRRAESPRESETRDGNAERPEGGHYREISVAASTKTPPLPAEPHNYDSSDSDLADLISKDPNLAILHNVRLCLLILAQIYFRDHRRTHHKYCVVTGLNLCYNFPLKAIYSRFLAMYGCLRIQHEGKEQEGLRFMKTAAALERRSDVFSMVHLHEVIAQMHFQVGQYEDAIKHLDEVIRAAKIAGDIVARERAHRLKAIIMFFTEKRSESRKEANALRSWAIEEDYWLGSFWGTLLFLTNLNDSSLVDDIEEQSDRLHELWQESPLPVALDPAMELLYLGVQAKADIRAGRIIDPLAICRNFMNALKRIGSEQSYIPALAIHHAASAIHLMFEMSWLTDSRTKSLANSFMSIATSKLKAMKWLRLAYALYLLWGGAKLVMRGHKIRADAKLNTAQHNRYVAEVPIVWLKVALIRMKIIQRKRVWGRWGERDRDEITLPAMHARYGLPRYELRFEWDRQFGGPQEPEFE
ncbi:uncharacterized protein SPPG_09415 [Spizellomyces punctatus DAOM BR117]|uniref:Guanylate cyclase domain-containing protein n=1 Tax=Spizellomyces punctatus (strain DAOM BR117) TaxID=645134 RepID=A0A0L0HAX7_SPIPD|nr:uncharacterized protein SPPG_09415 [Spizellomyces punctatus DAOM BR117]KNC97873.1 hypothetical protein SPPG_09415 [Spizellomyces punctatus DAOM BR117]|eukprot:XP_016605913.1 hypothetical protein SPPG_09415 [Spizellomyces punctatus DAOM BR117]